MDTRSARTRTRTLVRLMFANPASAVYLGLVAASMVVAVADPLFGENADASMIWVWPALFTFPVFGIVAGIGEAVFGAETPAWFFVGGIVVAALAQSLALGAVLDSLRRRQRRRVPRPHGG
ncbi:hypothetical protein ADK57_29830 [Streptomyces sp. MMG1533]|uniref:SCO4225 family membrane protein n=1 Tax=Streptomyces sp. MMG1533 TaxID=1415546 RepID=UPI0006AE34D9|nr:hypothetical protein [Streptomyces sp. MMG1533]KOU60598.1 hypothetical protein ADK57_29830 [Streptomyces sp. MMG1533]